MSQNSTNPLSSSDLTAWKKEVRRQVLERRDALPAEVIAQKSAAIWNRLAGLPEFIAARRVMFFVTFGSEVLTDPMIRTARAQGKEVAVPKTVPKEKRLIPSLLLDLEEDLAVGHYGVREPMPAALRPVDPATLDLVIVPGVAFTEKGQRLGYGAGFYDRFLLLAPQARRVAIAFDLQVVPWLPVGEHDLPVHTIVTETRVIRCL